MVESSFIWKTVWDTIRVIAWIGLVLNTVSLVVLMRDGLLWKSSIALFSIIVDMGLIYLAYHKLRNIDGR